MFISESRVIKIVRSNQPKELGELLKSTYFKEKCKPIVGLFFDLSRPLKGRQSIQNRLLFMRTIKYPWKTEKTLGDDILKIETFSIYSMIFLQFVNYLTYELFQTLFRPDGVACGVFFLG